jgi:cellulose synthase/poly-beta-1,6-N-acetylglucosamine synthase-like glycosyltransferase
MYRTDILRRRGGWPRRTMTEDLDLTWSYYRLGQRVRYVPEAVCYPLEPHNLKFMGGNCDAGHTASSRMWRSTGAAGSRSRSCARRWRSCVRSEPQ